MRKIIKLNFYNIFPTFGLSYFKKLFSFLEKDYDFRLSQNPDFLFYSNYNPIWNQPALPNISWFNGIKIYIEGEYMEWEKLKDSGYDYITTGFNVDAPNHFRFGMPMKRILFCGFDPEKILIKDKKVNMDFVKREKTKFCNFLYSNDISYRNYVFDFINKYYKKIDSGGGVKNNLGYRIGNREGFNWSYDEKYLFVKDYKFTMAFENICHDRNYSEKLTDPMIMSSIPIYWGGFNIGSEFNPKSFINFHDFKNAKELIDKIKEIDNNDDLWEAMLNEPWFKNNELPYYFKISELENFFKIIFER